MATKRGLGWVPNCTRGCRHLLPVAASGFGCAAKLLGLHSAPRAPGAPTALLIQPLIPQVLQTGEMWLLLGALCLAQGLEDAIPGAETFHNPERFMNIVSAGGAPHFPRSVPIVLPEGPAVLSPSLHLHLASLWGSGQRKSLVFALLALTSCPQLELGLSLLSL